MHTIDELRDMKIEDVQTREASWNEVAVDMMEAFDGDEAAARAEHDREWVLYYDGVFYRELRARVNEVAEDRLVDIDVLMEHFSESNWNIGRALDSIVQYVEEEVNDPAFWTAVGLDQHLHLIDL